MGPGSATATYPDTRTRQSCTHKTRWTRRLTTVPVRVRTDNSARIAHDFYAAIPKSVVVAKHDRATSAALLSDDACARSLTDYRGYLMTMLNSTSYRLQNSGGVR